MAPNSNIFSYSSLLTFTNGKCKGQAVLYLKYLTLNNAYNT